MKKDFLFGTCILILVALLLICYAWSGVTTTPTFTITHYLPDGEIVIYENASNPHTAAGDSLGFMEWGQYSGRYTYIQGTYKVKPSYKAIRHVWWSNEWNIVDD